MLFNITLLLSEYCRVSVESFENSTTQELQILIILMDQLVSGGSKLAEIPYEISQKYLVMIFLACGQSLGCYMYEK